MGLIRNISILSNCTDAKFTRETDKLQNGFKRSCKTLHVENLMEYKVNNGKYIKYESYRKLEIQIMFRWIMFRWIMNMMHQNIAALIMADGNRFL